MLSRYRIPPNSRKRKQKKSNHEHDLQRPKMTSKDLKRPQLPSKEVEKENVKRLKGINKKS